MTPSGELYEPAGRGSAGTRQQANIDMARHLLAAVGDGLDAGVIATLFASNARIEVPGDDGVLPGIGYRSGRAAAAALIEHARQQAEPVEFQIEDVLASPSRAVIVGELAARFRATDKVVDTAFAIILTIARRRITRLQMLQDSFAVSRAARSG